MNGLFSTLTFDEAKSYENYLNALDYLQGLTRTRQVVQVHLDQLKQIGKFMYEEDEKNPFTTIDIYFRPHDSRAPMREPVIMIPTLSGMVKADTQAFLEDVFKGTEDKLKNDPEKQTLYGKEGILLEQDKILLEDIKRFNRPKEFVTSGLPKNILKAFLGNWVKEVARFLDQLNDQISIASEEVVKFKNEYLPHKESIDAKFAHNN